MACRNHMLDRANLYIGCYLTSRMGILKALGYGYNPSKPRIRLTKEERIHWEARDATMMEYKEALKASRVTSRAYKEALSEFIDLEDEGLISPDTTKDKNIAALDGAGVMEEILKGVNIPLPYKRGILGYMKGHPEVVDQIAANVEAKFGKIITPDKVEEKTTTS